MLAPHHVLQEACSQALSEPRRYPSTRASPTSRRLHLFPRRVRRRPGLDATCTDAVRTCRIHAIALITKSFHCGRELRRAQNLSFARTVLALPLRDGSKNCLFSEMLQEIVQKSCESLLFFIISVGSSATKMSEAESTRQSKG